LQTIYWNHAMQIKVSKWLLIGSLGWLWGSAGMHQVALADSWVRVYTNPRDQTVLYIDKNSIAREGSYRYFWIHSARTDQRALGNWQGRAVYGVNYYYSTDCQTTEIRLWMLELFDQKGRRLMQQDTSGRNIMGQFALDRPAGRGVANYVCGTKR